MQRSVDKAGVIVAQEFGRLPVRTVSVVESLGKTLHLPPTGVGQRGAIWQPRYLCFGGNVRLRLRVRRNLQR